MSRRRFRPLRFSVGQKFLLVLAVLLSSILAVALVGAAGMRALKDEADALYLENIAELGHAAELSSELNAAVQTAVRLTSATEGVNRPALRSQLRRDVDAAEHQVEELRLDPNIDELTVMPNPEESTTPASAKERSTLAAVAGAVGAAGD